MMIVDIRAAGKTGLRELLKTQPAARVYDIFLDGFAKPRSRERQPWPFALPLLTRTSRFVVHSGDIDRDRGTPPTPPS